ncbi:MAG: hypothetical protein FWG39_00390 [Alphaproteobacteria bacterium]|nr:hypothetical protein [Alphaproteobacteria bacterium]
MKKHVLLLAVFLCACSGGGAHNDFPVKAVDLACGEHEYIFVYTDSWASAAGGAGFTLDYERVASERGARYEGDHSGAFWNNGKQWFHYKNKHLGNGEWGPSDTPTPCKLTHTYSKDEILKLGDPYFTVTESGEIIPGEFD